MKYTSMEEWAANQGIVNTADLPTDEYNYIRAQYEKYHCMQKTLNTMPAETFYTGLKVALAFNKEVKEVMMMEDIETGEKAIWVELVTGFAFTQRIKDVLTHLEAKAITDKLAERIS